MICQGDIIVAGGEGTSLNVLKLIGQSPSGLGVPACHYGAQWSCRFKERLASAVKKVNSRSKSKTDTYSPGISLERQAQAWIEQFGNHLPLTFQPSPSTKHKQSNWRGLGSSQLHWEMHKECFSSLFSNWKNNKESIEKVESAVFSVLQTGTEKIFRFHLEFVSILRAEVE